MTDWMTTKNKVSLNIIKYISKDLANLQIKTKSEERSEPMTSAIPVQKKNQ